MKIAICITKTGNDAFAAYKGFEMGARKNGDETEVFQNVNKIDRYNPDVLFMISYPQFDNNAEVLIDEHPNLIKTPPFNFSPANEFRKSIIQYANKRNKRMVFLDTGVYGCKRDRVGNPENHYQVGYDCIKGLGQYYNKDSPSDRFDKWGVELKDWKQVDNGLVLVAGQVRYGIGSQHIDIQSWYRIVMQHLKDNRFSIGFIEHPNNLSSVFTHDKFKFKVIQSGDDMYDNVMSSITFSSNFAIQNIINGIPQVCYSRLSPAYSVCGGTFEDIIKKKTFDRKQFLYDIAYTQWNINEMESGECWNHLRKYATESPSALYPSIRKDI